LNEAVIAAADSGVHQIDKIYLEVGKNFGASRWQTFRTIALPGVAVTRRMFRTFLRIAIHPEGHSRC
jgi:ABC-type nitrate/sulfonate/bicarbonate transport system permease component